MDDKTKNIIEKLGDKADFLAREIAGSLIDKELRFYQAEAILDYAKEILKTAKI